MHNENTNEFKPGYILCTAPSIMNIKNIRTLKKSTFAFDDGEKHYIIIITFLCGDTMALAYPTRRQRDEGYYKLKRILFKDNMKVINGTRK